MSHYNPIPVEECTAFPPKMPCTIKGVLNETPLLKKMDNDNGNDWDYLGDQFQNKTMPVYLVPRYTHGSRDYIIREEEGSDWIFEQDNELGVTGQNRDVPKQVIENLNIPSLPSYLQNMNWAWWANNKDLNSGLHFDESEGGYLGVLTGKKEALLIPPEDGHNIPQKQYFGDKHRSEVFAWEYVRNNEDHPTLTNATMYKAVIEKGDMLFIPHKWFHEVESIPKTVGISAWTRDIYNGNPLEWCNYDFTD